jgi:GAF domain-containing protein
MMFAKIKDLLALPGFEDQEKARVANLLHTILWGMFGAVAAITPILIIFNDTLTSKLVAGVIVGSFLILTPLLLWLLRLGRVELAGWLLTILTWVRVTVAILFFGGVRSSAVSGFLLAIIIASLVLGQRAAIIMGFLSLLSALGVFWAEYYFNVNTINPFSERVGVDNLFIVIALIGLATLLMMIVARNIAESLKEARANSRALSESVEELRRSRIDLQNRTRELERRSVQLRTAAEIARDATAVRKQDELLGHAVELIRKRFEFYRTSIFLIGERGEHAVLRAASGESADEMLRQNVRLKVGGASVVGYVTGKGKPRVIMDAEAERGRLKKSTLAETSSEVMLPLQVGGRVIGALGVQSQEVNAFDESDVSVLETLADQLAVAIENVRLLDEMHRTVQELEAASGQYTQRTWQSIAQETGRPQGYRYREVGIEPVAKWPPWVLKSWQEGQLVITSPGDDGKKEAGVLAVPVKLRGEVVGALNLQFEEEDEISNDTVALIEAVADRLALALENARLLEESQRRAARERTTREITDKMRRAAGVERIVQTALDEVYDKLGLSRAFVQLGHTPVEEAAEEGTDRLDGNGTDGVERGEING